MMPTGRTRVLATTPLFVVADLQRSLDFYCRKLAFGEPTVHGEPPCFAMIRRDQFELMLSRATSPEQIRPNGVNGVWDVYIRIADVTVELAALRAASVAIDRRPTRTFYGMLEMEVLDPDGYRICFGQQV